MSNSEEVVFAVYFNKEKDATWLAHWEDFETIHELEEWFEEEPVGSGEYEITLRDAQEKSYGENIDSLQRFYLNKKHAS